MNILNVIHAGNEWRGEICNQKKNGKKFWTSMVCSPIKKEGASIAYVLYTLEDITRTHQLSERLSFEASHDSLTGLVNRREFERRTERLLDSTGFVKDGHALCFMDLDQFKVVNDTCGHAAGDQLLCQLAAVLQSKTRKRDTLARLGGDEFGVLMEHCPLDNAYRVATGLKQAVQDFQFLWEGKLFKVGVSIGLVPITKEIKDVTEVMVHADAACYMAKDLGRNRVHVYHRKDKKLVQRKGEMQWVTRIHTALTEGRLLLYAQPIEPLTKSKNECSHYELLVRMKDEEGNIIPPGAFLPAAERYNLITILDRWVVDTSIGILTDHPQWLSQTGFCSINLSGQSLSETAFLDHIVNTIKTSKISAQKICFEITETAAITHLASATYFISTLRQLGCRFALDDFGSGLSSFGYLKNLKVDYLKIDGMFIQHIVSNPIDYAMVKSINDIGHVMELKTIAEFVENDETIEVLREIGVDYVQGYGVGKPLPLLEHLLRNKPSKKNNIIPLNTASRLDLRSGL